MPNRQLMHSNDCKSLLSNPRYFTFTRNSLAFVIFAKSPP